MFYLHSRQFMKFEAAKNVILAVSLFFFCVSAEIAWSQNYKVKHLQSKLTLSGFDPGPVDGFWGKRTASALAKMLNANGIEISSITKRDISKEALAALNQSYHFHSEKLELEIMHLQKIVNVVDARHLLERTGLGAHPSEVESLLGLTRSKAISQILENIDAILPSY